MTAPFHPHLATRQATVTDDCVVLILLLQLQTRSQFTLATKIQIWHGLRILQPAEECFDFWLFNHSAYVI